MIANTKIGVLGVTPESHPKLFNYLQSIGEVLTLSPTTMRAKYDVVVLPPGTGISPNLQCFKHGNRTLVPTALISPSIEKFREESLAYYLALDTYIIGLGDNAALLWDHLGGKAVPTSLGVMCLECDGVEYDELFNVDNDMIGGFRKNNIFGLSDVEPKFGGDTVGLGKILATIADEIAADLIDPDEEEEKYNPQPKPSLDGESTWPEEEEISVNKLYEDSV
jgi:hypothetical protein